MLAGARILIVDDDPSNVLLLARILGQAGFRAVDGVTESKHAVDRFRALNPDLVLLDLLMPGRDGFEVLADLRELIPPDVFLPIVVLTGDSRLDRRFRALDSGANDFILKPFHPAEVVLRVQSLLSLRMSYVDQHSYSEQLESLVRERTRDIYEHGEFLRALLDCLDEGIVACDSKGDLRLATEVVRRIGLDARMFGPHAQVPLDRIYSIDHALPLAAEQEPLTRAYGGEHVTGFELAVDDERGSTSIVATARPILDAAGDKIGAVMALRDVTESRKIEEDYRHRALHDPLTDLPNRTLFLDRLEQVLAKLGRAAVPIAVLFIDIDNFKVINDTLGHAAGDRVLMTTAELAAAVHPTWRHGCALGWR